MHSQRPTIVKHSTSSRASICDSLVNTIGINNCGYNLCIYWTGCNVQILIIAYLLGFFCWIQRFASYIFWRFSSSWCDSFVTSDRCPTWPYFNKYHLTKNHYILSHIHGTTVLAIFLKWFCFFVLLFNFCSRSFRYEQKHHHRT